MVKAKTQYTLTPDANKETVLVTYFAGRLDYNRQPIINRFEIGYETYRGEITYRYRRLRYAGDRAADWWNRQHAGLEVTPEGITAAEQALVALLADKAKRIERAHRSWQYKLLAAEAKRYGWPAHFATDLTQHDAWRIANENPQVFLWCLRDAGTWLIRKGDEGLRDNVARQEGESAHYYEISRAGARPLTLAQFMAYKFKE